MGCNWKIFTFGFVMALLCLGAPGEAQDVIDANVSDLDDFRTGFKNPASLSYLPNQLIFGSAADDIGVNPGFFDLSNGYIGYYSPSWEKRFGLDSQFLRTGIFNQTNIGVSFSERVHRLFALGGRLDVVNQAFDQNNFQDVDAGDPVLSSGLSKNYYSLAMGVVVMPVPDFSIGAVVENINRPNVAMDTDNDFRLPVDYGVGFQYRTDRFHPSVDLSYEDSALRYRLRLGVVFLDDHMFRFDYRKEKIGFEGHFRLYRGFQFNYRYQYPLNELNTFSSGSHNLSFVYDFNKIIDLPGLLHIQHHPDRVSLVRSAGEIPVEGDFFVFSSTRVLEILEVNITRKADDDIPLDFIRRNYHKIFGERDEEPASNVDTTTLYADSLQGLVGTYTDHYKYSLDSLVQFLESAKQIETTIYSSEDDLRRAENLREFIAGKSDILSDRIELLRRGAPSEIAGDGGDEIDLSLIGRTETRIILSDEEVEFRILALNMDDYNGPWSLLILDREGELVKEFSGRGNVPDGIVWGLAWGDRGAGRPGFV